MANYNRINKPTARKMFNMGCDIVLLPCKVEDEAVDGSHPSVKPVTINTFYSKYNKNKFDREISDFEYYKCNAELGYYAHYFVSDEEIEKYNLCELMCR